jgi:hypothetical protein
MLVAAIVAMAAPAQGATNPMVQVGPKLTASGELGAGAFGSSVAVSSDGTTAVIGAPSDNAGAGAAFVFVRSGSTWTQQAELTGAGEAGSGNFGAGVAISANGDEVLVGAPSDEAGKGAAWSFARSGASWTQLGTKLAGSVEEGRYGAAVALSANGKTALVGEPQGDELGAVWVLKRSGSGFAAPGHELTGGPFESGCKCGVFFGASLALSADGRTALIGGPANPAAEETGFEHGTAWVFVRTGSKWTQQGGRLPSGAGARVALSADGNTALLNEHGYESFLYTRSGAAWSFSTTLEGGERNLGCACLPSVPASVALSAAGDVALIGYSQDGQEFPKGGPGAAWTFARSGESWSQVGPKLLAGEEVGFAGFGVAAGLSGDGLRALIGGSKDNSGVGGAWYFASPTAPVLSGLSPRHGPAAGGTSVTISGSGLTGATAVDFGTTPAEFTVASDSSILAVASPAAIGKVDVEVTTPYGTSAVTTQDRFTYGAH